MLLYTKLIRHLYTLFHYLALPAILLRLLWRSRHNPEYRRRWLERLGYIQPITAAHQSIWIHAVSVGETKAAIPMIKKLIERHPNSTLIVTTTTPTGSAEVIKHLNDQVQHSYAPYDVPNCVNRFLKRSQPTLCIIMETELWPNLLHCCEQRNIAVLLANGRMSLNSFRNYQHIKSLTKSMLRSFSMIAAQSNLDGERFLALGVKPQSLMISGNIKFDIQIPHDLKTNAQSLREQWQAQKRPIMIAASTHEGEDALVLEAFMAVRKKLPHTLLILVPRHPERFNKVEKLCRTKPFQLSRRSIKQIVNHNTDILLGDTMGELLLLYAASDVAFVGGSLVPVGGHNLIEPAALGLPTITGPHVHNFMLISKLLLEAGATHIVDHANALAETAITLLSNTPLREKIGGLAKEVINVNQGALAKHLEWIKQEANPGN